MTSVEAIKQANEIVEAAGILVMETIRKEKIKGYDQFKCIYIRDPAKALQIFG